MVKREDDKNKKARLAKGSPADGGVTARNSSSIAVNGVVACCCHARVVGCLCPVNWGEPPVSMLPSWRVPNCICGAPVLHLLPGLGFAGGVLKVLFCFFLLGLPH